MKIGFWGPWLILKDGRIRRCRRARGKLEWESLPKNQYKNLSEGEKESLLRRLNADHESFKKLEEQRRNQSLNSAYVNPFFLEKFEEDVKRGATRLPYIKLQRRYLEKFVFPFFVIKKGLQSPKEWKSEEAAWGIWLREKKLSANYILKISNALNRYIKILKKNIPNFPTIEEIEPLGKSVIREMNSQNEVVGKYIKDSDFEIIKEKIDESIRPLVLLGYYYGLRKREILALQKENIRNSYLLIEKQLISADRLEYSTLKGKDKRKCPHWFISANECYRLILKIKLMHPDSFSKKFDSEMKKLKMDYKLHDLRRTFISKSLKVHHWTLVQSAVGHKHVKTTMSYMRDDRILDDEIFQPDEFIKR